MVSADDASALGLHRSARPSVLVERHAKAGLQAPLATPWNSTIYSAKARAARQALEDGRGADLVQRSRERVQAQRVQGGSGSWVGCESAPCSRPGGADAYRLPSRVGQRLHWPDGRVTPI